MDILIKDAIIITQNEAREIIKGDIVIKENRIEKIGKNLNEKVDEKIDCKRKLVFPGFINTHTHVAMTLFRGYGEGMRLQQWLEQKIWPAEAKLKPNDVYHGAMLGIAEMIRSGTTSFNEMYVFGLERIADAGEKSGIRTSIGLGMLDKMPEHYIENELRANDKFVSSLKSESDRIKASVCCHAPYTCSSELIIKAKEYANKKNLQFHIHVSETRKEVFDIIKEKGKSPFEYLDSLGILDAKSVFAHSVYVTKREIALGGKNKINISHNPVSNLKLAGGGICPISEFMRAGANVSLGTDGAASNNSLNIIETMKMAALLQKNFYWDASAISAQQVLDFATINGAKALGVDSGAIEKGKLADIVIADLKSPNMAPYHNHVANIVYAINPANICDVIIDGELIMKDKKILLFDEEEVIEKAVEAAENVAT
ncbi:MAG: amidohydrolase [Candidatus Micrarchaeota archaeon]